MILGLVGRAGAEGKYRNGSEAVEGREVMPEYRNETGEATCRWFAAEEEEGGWRSVCEPESRKLWRLGGGFAAPSPSLLAPATLLWEIMGLLFSTLWFSAAGYFIGLYTLLSPSRPRPLRCKEADSAVENNFE